MINGSVPSLVTELASAISTLGDGSVIVNVFVQRDGWALRRCCRHAHEEQTCCQKLLHNLNFSFLKIITKDLASERPFVFDRISQFHLRKGNNGPKKGRHVASPFFQNFLDLFVAAGAEGRQELQQVRCTDLTVSVQITWARAA